MARRIRERKLKNLTITIIGEGATERYYFTHLKDCVDITMSANREILLSKRLMKCGSRLNVCLPITELPYAFLTLMLPVHYRLKKQSLKI